MINRTVMNIMTGVTEMVSLRVNNELLKKQQLQRIYEREMREIVGDTRQKVNRIVAMLPQMASILEDLQQKRKGIKLINEQYFIANLYCFPNSHPHISYFEILQTQSSTWLSQRKNKTSDGSGWSANE